MWEEEGASITEALFMFAGAKCLLGSSLDGRVFGSNFPKTSLKHRKSQVRLHLESGISDKCQDIKDQLLPGHEQFSFKKGWGGGE